MQHYITDSPDIEDIINTRQAPLNDAPTYSDFYYDVVVIGAGAVGCATARELSKYEGLKVLIVEAGDDVSSGATKANSGIAHGGYDAHHGTLKSKLCHRGTQMMPQLNKDLHFGYRRTGSLVLAFTQDEVERLSLLLENGRKNGVSDLEIITDSKRIFAMEPNVSRQVIAALYCPHTGIMSPYEYCIALMENALLNAGNRGMDLWLNHTVCDVVVEPSKRYKFQIFIDEYDNKRIYTQYVINASGVRADMVAAFANANQGVHIVPRKGEYVVLERDQGSKINHVLFQVPSDAHGKGILVSPTVRGNLLLGPTSVYSDSVNTGTTRRHLAMVLRKARKTFPNLDTKRIITTYAGIRPNSNLSHRDFIIEESKKVSKWINAAGIGSPGLTSSYPIALMVVDLLRNAGLRNELAIVRANWRATRRGIISENWIKLHMQSSEETQSQIRVGHPNPRLNIICRCELVTELTIIDACHRLIPVKTLQAVKFRTRAGMGRCQGRRCHHQVSELVSNATGIPIAEVLRGDESRVGRRVHPKEVSKL